MLDLLYVPLLYVVMIISVRTYVMYSGADSIALVTILISQSLKLLLPVALAQEHVEENLEMVPYVSTPLIESGVKALNKMYNYLPAESTLKQFLTDYALFLLSPLTGDTPILATHLEPSYILNHKDAVDLGPKYSITYTTSHSVPLQGTAGVYVYVDPKVDKIAQCGSNIN